MLASTVQIPRLRRHVPTQGFEMGFFHHELFAMLLEEETYTRDRDRRAELQGMG